MNEVMNLQARLSEHFSLGELCKTSVKGVDNTPNHAAVLNLKRICQDWLEPLRQAQGPIIINSGFRSEAVNKAIGGVKGSNHLTGCAVDIHVSGIEQAIRYATILLDWYQTPIQKPLATLRREAEWESKKGEVYTDLRSIVTG